MPAARTSSAGSLPAVQARMRLAGGGGMVSFPYNPGSVSISKVTSIQGNGQTVVTNDYQQHVAASGDVTISIGDVKLLGPKTKSYVDMLFQWTRPLESAGVTRGSKQGGPPAPSGGGTKKAGGSQFALPVLTMEWARSRASTTGGAGGGPSAGASSKTMLSYQVTLRQVSVKYERFTSAGMPVLATVSMTLQASSSPLQKANPTSGGPARRRGRTVTSGDNIVRIATDTYGDPSTWRAVAEVNRLDDPLRIKPGQRLYLPNPDDLDTVLTHRLEGANA